MTRPALRGRTPGVRATAASHPRPARGRSVTVHRSRTHHPRPLRAPSPAGRTPGDR
ncbi:MULTISPECIES: hypothetical protein [unclassified Pseudonocardia]|uniref:hypothetical protein n=1 Tax=unclassified Pseudonocardia TaxID=2619320 RepID=UPI000962C60B|nr:MULTISPECIES: hypothetical protein [unclassified Pseudonocardia]OLL98757.1 hypothetical protein Ae331Ps2_2424 [Pseudonocardia sp. Ae331_Ps2]OLM25062.1 hypothetical protein Ae706Ps2_3495c [Pseudonocardia sp. Ae706_Ps2]